MHAFFCARTKFRFRRHGIFALDGKKRVGFLKCCLSNMGAICRYVRQFARNCAVVRVINRHRIKNSTRIMRTQCRPRHPFRILSVLSYSYCDRTCKLGEVFRALRGDFQNFQLYFHVHVVQKLKIPVFFVFVHSKEFCDNFYFAFLVKFLTLKYQPKNTVIFYFNHKITYEKRKYRYFSKFSVFVE